MLNTLWILKLELPNKLSLLFQIQVQVTSGFTHHSAKVFHAISIKSMTILNPQPILLVQLSKRFQLTLDKVQLQEMFQSTQLDLDPQHQKHKTFWKLIKLQDSLFTHLH
jgi:hypothetical protein